MSASLHGAILHAFVVVIALIRYASTATPAFDTPRPQNPYTTRPVGCLGHASGHHLLQHPHSRAILADRRRPRLLAARSHAKRSFPVRVGPWGLSSSTGRAKGFALSQGRGRRRAGRGRISGSAWTLTCLVDERDCWWQKVSAVIAARIGIECIGRPLKKGPHAGVAILPSAIFALVLYTGSLTMPMRYSTSGYLQPYMPELDYVVFAESRCLDVCIWLAGIFNRASAYS
ncbi:hypothetical protein WOLCODRAFT_151857 [Wolfiporia cocos MD-104 SS10]|uniref:Uncharacterized protein n=1 Tax=Wolfiporia cocos (strain MD-104) TaxID=742152 RepID=A0A2H3JIX5_WOLCO|nr:hypothetical protein WOLCODRAFT_151857 [Wolfiporia cocos MD-104 SS10]